MTNLASRAFYNCPIKNDVSAWQLDSLLEIGNQTLNTAPLPLHGILNLPSVRTVGDWGCGHSMLDGIVFGVTGGVMIAGSAFNDCQHLTNIVFEGAAPSQTTLDNLLVAAAASEAGSHSRVIYASKLQPGWTQIAAVTNAAEKMPPNRCFGVYRAGNRKAWLVNRRSTYDLHYFYFIICDNAGLTIPFDWLTNTCPQVSADDVPACSNALVSVGANGLARWQSYVLGLDPRKADSVVLCDARQDASADGLTFFAKNVAPVTNDTCSVSYVLEGSQDGSRWQDLARSPANLVQVSLPCTCCLFRFRTDILLQ